MSLSEPATLWILLAIAHAVATTLLTGLIWFVQIVHYPLFARVGRESFVAYEAEHVRRTGWIVAPAMALEAITATLLILAPLSPAGRGLVFTSWLALLAVWLSTLLVQVPLHRALSRGFDEVVGRRLVRTNAVRAALWTLRAALAIGIVVVCIDDLALITEGLE